MEELNGIPINKFIPNASRQISSITTNLNQNVSIRLFSMRFLERGLE